MKTLSTITIVLLAIFSFACTDDDATSGSIYGNVEAGEGITAEEIAEMMIYIEFQSDTVYKDSADLDATGEFKFADLELGTYMLYVNDENDVLNVTINEKIANCEVTIIVDTPNNVVGL